MLLLGAQWAPLVDNENGKGGGGDGSATAVMAKKVTIFHLSLNCWCANIFEHKRQVVDTEVY